MIGILKKFIKGFGLLLFDRTQHIGLSAIFLRRFIESRRSVLHSFTLFSLIGIMKKFIKGFGLLLFGRTQYVGLSAIFV